MLISHRQSAYVDNGELERAAGMLEIRAKTLDHDQDLYAAAAFALRILQTSDLTKAEDFLRVFEHTVIAAES